VARRDYGAVSPLVSGAHTGQSGAVADGSPGAEREFVREDVGKILFAGLIAIPLVSALLSYWLPIPFAIVAVPLGAVWISLLAPRVFDDVRERFRHRDAPIREGFAPSGGDGSLDGRRSR
jgi:hypothetical protein